MNVKTRLAVSVLFLSITSVAHSSGFRVPEVSVAGIGTANAMVANPDEIGSLPYNPANMSFMDGRSLLVGMTYLDVTLHVDPEAGVPTDSTAEDTFLIPHYYYTNTVNKEWSYGFFINVPFGLETKRPKDTFTRFAGPVDGLEPEMSKIEMININPNVSYKMGNTSFAFGIDYYDVRELIFNTQTITITGDGSDIGWNIAAQHLEGPLNLGISYRSNVNVGLSGSVAVSGITGSAKADLGLPSILQIGARYKLDRDWSVEFDIDRTGWSSFDEINITHTNNALISAPGGSNKIISTNNWEDANAYRLGAIWRIDPKGELRMGFSIDQSPQGDDFYTPRIPDNDRKLFSVGYQRNMKTWSFELGYMLAKVDDRTVNSSTDYLTQVNTTGNTDANGTNAYNGTYESTVHILGASFSMSL